jgi:hypothetical protein
VSDLDGKIRAYALRHGLNLTDANERVRAAGLAILNSQDNEDKRFIGTIDIAILGVVGGLRPQVRKLQDELRNLVNRLDQLTSITDDDGPPPANWVPEPSAEVVQVDFARAR